MTREERQAKALRQRNKYKKDLKLLQKVTPREYKRILQAKRSKANKERTRYNPLDLICVLHNVKFVNWIYIYPSKKFNKCHSHGCPVCVGLIRAKVRMEINRNSAWNKNGRRYLTNPRRPDAPTKRGRPKTAPATAAIETGNGI